MTPSPAAQPALGAYSTTWFWGHKTLVPQPLSPSPPFPRGRTLLTCLPKESETPLPPPLSRALVSRRPRGGGAALSEAALPPPPQPAPEARRPRPLRAFCLRVGPLRPRPRLHVSRPINYLIPLFMMFLNILFTFCFIRDIQNMDSEELSLRLSIDLLVLPKAS